MKKLKKSVLTFIIIMMMTMIKNLPKLKVSHNYKKLKTPALHAFAHGTKFAGDPLCGSPDVPDATIYSDADAMLSAYTVELTNPSKAQTALVKSLRKTLLTALDLNSNYLEGKANAAAIAAGDSAVGANVINRINFQLAGKGIMRKIIGIVETATGWVHVREAKTIKGVEGHVWEAGVTTAKGVPPTTVKRWFTITCDCIFFDIPSGTIIGYHHASIVSGGRKTTPTGLPAIPKSLTSKTTSLLPASKSKHPMIDFNNANPYTFGEWRYVIIP
ncbi:MAG: hypothetical protein ABR968_07750 [Bacteroidales bacterium]|jgi:hypothetical protein